MFRTRWHYQGILVKFKLEVGISEDQLIQIASASRTASGANLIVANTLEMVQGAQGGAYIIGPAPLCRRVARAQLADQLRHLVLELLTTATAG